MNNNISELIIKKGKKNFTKCGKELFLNLEACPEYETEINSLSQSDAIGSGESGSVYAYCMSGDCSYVVKIQEYTTKKNKQYFKTEILALCDLQKTNIVPKLYTYFTFKNQSYVITEKIQSDIDDAFKLIFLYSIPNLYKKKYDDIEDKSDKLHYYFQLCKMPLTKNIRINIGLFLIEKIICKINALKKKNWIHVDPHIMNIRFDIKFNVVLIDFGDSIKKGDLITFENSNFCEYLCNSTYAELYDDDDGTPKYDTLDSTKSKCYYKKIIKKEILKLKENIYFTLADYYQKSILLESFLGEFMEDFLEEEERKKYFEKYYTIIKNSDKKLENFTVKLADYIFKK